MKKYLNLSKKKQKLETIIAKECNKFTHSTGLIIKDAIMDIAIKEIEMSEVANKILPIYKVEINCEL